MHTQVLQSIRNVGLPAYAVLIIMMAGCGGSDSTPTASISPSASAADQQAAKQPLRLDSPGQSSESPARRPAPPKNLHPKVEIVTTVGTIRVELDGEKAPKTVANFVENYVRTGFYEQTIFHYVDRGFMVAAGGYTSDFQAKDTRTEIRHEGGNGLKNLAGTIAMARHPQYIDSATSQFFFNLADNAGLDFQVVEQDDPDKIEPSRYGYCVFGRVVEGMDVLQKIAQVQVTDKDEFPKTPVQPVVIQSVRVVQ